MKKRKYSEAQGRFAIRKLTVGVTSVLLGLVCLGVNQQVVKADTEATAQSATTQQTKELDSYQGLNKFLKTKQDVPEDTRANHDANQAKESTPIVQSAQPVEKTQSDFDYHAPSKPTTDGADITTTTDKEVGVANWQDLCGALANPNIIKIKVTHDITNNASQGDGNDGDKYIKMNQDSVRYLTIESDPDANTRYTIDFKHFRLRPQNNGDANKTGCDLTFSNLNLWSSTYYGLVEAEEVNSKITFNDITFHGSQMLYTGNKGIEIHYRNRVEADTVLRYDSPVDNERQVNWDDDTQQLLELRGDGSHYQEVYFDDNCNFTSATTGGNIIEMHGAKSSIVVGINANVTLAPKQNNFTGVNVAQNTGKASAIDMSGQGKIVIKQWGTLNINVGSSTFNGQLDAKAAAAITMLDVGSEIIVVRNGRININTNGDISDSWRGQANALVYTAGVLNIQGTFTLTGTNMQEYAGALLDVGNTINVDSGSLIVKTTGTGLTGAGMGKYQLVNAEKVNGLMINNPKQIVINSQANPNAQALKVSHITLNDTRRQFTLPDASIITLPPVHVVSVNLSNKTVKVSHLELLNGELCPTQSTIDRINAQNDSTKVAVAKLCGFSDVSAMQAQLQKDVDNKVDFDQIFTNVIGQTATDPTNPGYNNISFISANPSGYLNIADDNGIVGQASYHQDMKDGSVIITGKVVNYNNDIDGPAQQGNMFSNVMPVGTSAYVIAQFSDHSVYTDPKHLVQDPYENTNDGEDPTNITDDLSHEFTAKANADGTFSFKIPANYPELHSGMSIALTPEANFIELDPAGTLKPASVQIGNIADLSQIKITADNNIDQGLEIAKQRIIASGLSEADQQEFLDAVQDAHDNDEYYIDNATTFTTVNTYLTYAYDTYNQEGAKSEFKYYVQQCEQKLNITDADKDMQTVINNTMTLCNGAIATSIHSDHVESKTENCLTNQNRDWAEGYALDRFKCWVNDQMSALVTKQMNTCKNNPSLNLTADQIASLKDRSHTVLTFAQSDVTSASDIDVVVEKYQAGIKQINDFFTTNLYSISRNSYLDELQAYSITQKNVLKTLKKLPRATRNKYRLEINNVTLDSFNIISDCDGADLTTNYNDFKAKVDAIISAATAENNKL